MGSSGIKAEPNHGVVHTTTNYNYKDFASGIDDERKTNSSLSFNSSVEEGTLRKTVHDNLVSADADKSQSKAKSSTPRESMRTSKQQTTQKVKGQDQLSSKEDMQMLREKQEYLRQGPSMEEKESNQANKNFSDLQKESSKHKSKNKITKEKSIMEIQLENEGKRTKKYIITQQEIVFYLKNADRVLRIIHRPLMSRQENSVEKRNDMTTETG